MMMRAEVPGRAADWDAAIDRACEQMRVAAQAFVDHPTQQRLGDLEAARRAFGRHMLRLDRQRRPGFYAAENQ